MAYNFLYENFHQQSVLAKKCQLCVFLDVLIADSEKLLTPKVLIIHQMFISFKK